MIFSWFTTQRRNRLLAEPLPAAWLEILSQNVRHYRHLSPRRQLRVRQVVQVLVAEKNWEGGSGFAIAEEMKVTVAGQAAVLVIGLAEPYYFDDVQSIILYPGAYRHPAQYARPGAVYGESWYRGPIVLSWKLVLAGGRGQDAGGDLVFHEFAHYIDGLDGEVNGDPPLIGRRRQAEWFRAAEAAYRRLVGQARRGEQGVLDHYGATNRAEFFAVATESFFERPGALLREHADLYRVLRNFYRQDPARWLPDVPGSDKRTDRRSSDAEESKYRRTRRQRLAVLRSADTASLFTLAIAYYNERRYGPAAGAATRVLRFDAGDGEAHVQRAMARLKRGRLAAALGDAEAAVALDADDAEAYAARGAVYVEQGDYAQAKADLDRAIRLGQDDATVRFYRGRAWMGLGKPPRAVRDYTQSLYLREMSAEVYYHRALAQRALGKIADAKADLAKARQLDPNITVSSPPAHRRAGRT